MDDVEAEPAAGTDGAEREQGVGVGRGVAGGVEERAGIAKDQRIGELRARRQGGGIPVCTGRAGAGGQCGCRDGGDGVGACVPIAAPGTGRPGGRQQGSGGAEGVEGGSGGQRRVEPEGGLRGDGERAVAAVTAEADAERGDGAAVHPAQQRAGAVGRRGGRAVVPERAERDMVPPGMRGHPGQRGCTAAAVVPVRADRGWEAAGVPREEVSGAQAGTQGEDGDGGGDHVPGPAGGVEPAAGEHPEHMVQRADLGPTAGAGSGTGTRTGTGTSARGDVKRCGEREQLVGVSFGEGLPDGANVQEASEAEDQLVR